jgi:flavin reductase ActVB
VSTQALKDAMARVPGPVTIVTTVDDRGGRWGFTASSMCSLSLNPPLLLVCIDKASASYPAFMNTPAFLVNVLSVDQAELAASFGRISGPAKFAGSGMIRCERGLPGLQAATVRIACTMHAILNGGDHSILVGQVVKSVTGGSEPLVYCGRQFLRAGRR